MHPLKTNNRLKSSITLLILLAAAFSYITHTGNQAPPLTGEHMVDIGGYSIYMNSMGEGSPAVVFIAAHNSASSYWGSLPEEIARYSRVLAYDRAGIGNSHNATGERTADVIARELHTLLRKAKIKSPYILVGHSSGGLYARMFAAKYPKETAGIVLLDSSHEDQVKRRKESMTPEELQNYEESVKNYDEAMKSQQSPTRRYRETLSNIETSCNQVRQIRNKLKHIPITVIAADQVINASTGGVWLEFQQDIASQSDKGKFIVAENSSHGGIHYDALSLIVDEISSMLTLAKKQ